jgi:hypothetical protein
MFMAMLKHFVLLDGDCAVKFNFNFFKCLKFCLFFKSQSSQEKRRLLSYAAPCLPLDTILVASSY